MAEGVALAGWADRLAHPARTLRNACWKAEQRLPARLRSAVEAFREQFGPQPPWIVARNRRQTVVDYGPAYIFLEPTNACNLKCPLCPTGTGKAKRERGLMSVDLVQKVVGELRHKPAQFGFWLAGEPLLHPRIAEMVRIAAQAGLDPGIHSNGARLTPELARELIEAGLGWISFSFDGDTREDYERLRSPARFDDTIGKIRDFLRVRADLGRRTPRVIVQTLIPYQGGEVHPYGVQLQASESFRRMFAGAGVDEFRALLAHSWSGQLDGVEGVAPNRNRTGCRWVCIVPFRDLVIAWNGDILTCCGDLDGVNVLGEVRTKTVSEVWNGEGYQRFRRAMLSSEIETWPLCGGCERIWILPPHPQDYRLRFEKLRYRLRR